MIKNNKGFMLAEVVITSTIVLTTMVSLYATFNKLYNIYKIRESYYNIDGMYAIKGVVNNLLDESGDNNFNTILLKLDNGERFVDVVDVSSCDFLKISYGIKHVYIVNYDSGRVNSLINIKGMNQTFKDYLEYINKHYDWQTDKYKYLVLMEYGSDTNGLYYSSMGIG